MTTFPAGGDHPQSSEWHEQPGTSGYATEQGAPGEYGSGGEHSTVDVAKSEAGQVAEHATQAAGTVARTAREQGAQVGDEVRQQTRNVMREVQSQVSEQADTQQQRIAGGLRDIADQLQKLAGGTPQEGMVTDLVYQAAERTHRVAGWLDSRDSAGLLDSVRSYARQHPGAFLALALGGGLIAGRLARNADDDRGSDFQRSGTAKAAGQVPPASGVAARSWGAAEAERLYSSEPYGSSTMQSPTAAYPVAKPGEPL
jgi:hypothetical protein